ncbi:heavy metal translocating P-type ATPase [Roseibium litorale]|uniref:P-type Zn(2+) transporter n=1 Tax=Roseibium litorale TaxID=2803841 RepID=A0ABR9CJE2_9HYPH|nr:heavy metal translocating P-type ATPase [Roseibium litorale]MBD8890941.1 cadmium-translocating P-type ATPase [Roseibium litorale]
MTSPMQTRFRVSGMDCASCAAKIGTAARRYPGIEDAAVSVAAATLTLTHSREADLQGLSRKIEGLGYDLVPLPAPSPSGRSAPAAAHPHAEACGCGHPHGSDDEPHSHRDSKSGKQEHHDDDDHGQNHGHHHEPVEGAWWKSKKGKQTLLTGAALVLAYCVTLAVPALEPNAFTLAMLFGLVPIARRAFMAAKAGTPFSIEMLMTVAATGAVVLQATEEAAMVVFLFLIGELLEGVAARKARDGITALSALVPRTAFVETGKGIEEVPADSLQVGALILVRPGDRVPADGTIVSGSSSLNEAPVTGESVPVHKQTGEPVLAGTVNGDGALKVQVTAAAQDNTIARVVKLVEEAQETKAPTERFIDRFSRYYTPGVVAMAALVAFLPPLLAGGAWDEWVYKGLAILLIGCPCALVISTPAAIAASLSAGARRGLLMKGGAVLEQLGRLTAIAFDKTGTLTEGKPQVTRVLAFERPEAEVLSLAAALETGSSHPLAEAILTKAKADGLSIPASETNSALGGKGVRGLVNGEEIFLGSVKAAGELADLPVEQLNAITALHDQGQTVSVLIAGGRPAGAIAMRDEPRDDSIQGLQLLTSAGIRTLMLTGDNARTAKAVSERLGIEMRADLLPEDKQRIVTELKGQGFVVGKVGDGINDAPALAAADIGIAMGGGTDVALETADAAVLHGRVSDVAAMIRLSQRTMRNIFQNITIALGLKAVFLVTTIAGITGLWPAILADTGATVLVTLNALRLLRPVR